MAHTGWKASTIALWLSSGDIADGYVNGWPDNVYGPGPILYNEKHTKLKEMAKADIENFKSMWVVSLKHALVAGFDIVEIHNAHGYLLHSFVSLATNKCTDKYGGSFKNHIQLTLEIIEITRRIVPEDMPVFLQISATDWLEDVDGIEGWTVDNTVWLAGIIAEKGVDLINISSGGNHPKQQVKTGPGYQVCALFLTGINDEALANL